MINFKVPKFHSGLIFPSLWEDHYFVRWALYSIDPYVIITKKNLIIFRNILQNCNFLIIVNPNS
jgi:hypothetical protein